jgi:hypothetical protein
VSEDRYYRNVTRIQETYESSAANELLEKGWELLSIRETTRAATDASGKPAAFTGPVYVLGRTKQVGGGEPNLLQPGSDIEKVLLSLPWRTKSGSTHEQYVTTEDVLPEIKSHFEGLSEVSRKVKLSDGSSVYYTKYQSLKRYNP